MRCYICFFKIKVSSATNPVSFFATRSKLPCTILSDILGFFAATLYSSFAVLFWVLLLVFLEFLRIISKFVYIFIWKWILSNLTRFLGINLKIYVNYIAQKRNNRINLNKKKSSLCDIFVEIFYILRNIYTSLNAICGNVISHRSSVRSSSAVRFQTYQLRHWLLKHQRSWITVTLV